MKDYIKAKLSENHKEIEFMKMDLDRATTYAEQIKLYYSIFAKQEVRMALIDILTQMTKREL